MTADTLSIQLYAMRLHGDVDQNLDALAAIGFKQVETIGGHLADAAVTRAKLDARGLRATTSHVGLADLRTRLEWVAEQAKIIGIEELYMPAVAPEERWDRPAAFWQGLGAELGAMAERLAAHGLRLGYHNHHWEVKPYANASMPLNCLFKGAAGSKLSWQADIAWLVRGGADPVVLMERYRDRLTGIHVKDIARAGENVDEDGWCDIGKGTLDWPDLWKRSRALGARHMVLEHDKPKDAVAFARNGFAYLRNFPL